MSEVYINPTGNWDHLVFNICMLFETIFLPVMVFLIVKHSHQMSRYRYYILNNIFWCYLFDMLMFVARPTFLFPQSCIIMQPILPLPNVIFVLGIPATIFVLINVDLGVVYSLFYRYAMAFTGWFHGIFQKPCPIISIMVVVSFTITAYINGGILLSMIYHEADILNEFLKQLPELSNYTSQFTIFCIAKTDVARKFSLSVTTLLLIFFVLGSSLYCHLYYKMLKNKEALNSRTSKLQFMLFKAVGVQLIIGYIFLLFPGVIVTYVFYAQYENMAIVCSFCCMLMTFHGCIDYVTMIYFITPYRRAIMRSSRDYISRMTNGKVGQPRRVSTFFLPSIVVVPASG